MKIYTGYFAQDRNYRKAGLKSIAIALYLPTYYFGERYLNLAPMPYMMSKSMPPDVFDREYSKNVLGQTSPHQVYVELEQMSEGKDVVLLCYEKLQSECHRGNVARWMNQAGYDVQEYETERKPVPDASQGSLF